MKKLIVFVLLLFCTNIFMCNATQIINHNSFALVEDYIKTFKASQNDITFIFEGNGWKNKTFTMTSPKYLLGEFKEGLFKELSFNIDPANTSFSLEVLNADASHKEIEISMHIDLTKGKFIVLYWNDSDFSIKAYKKRPKF